MVQKVEEEGMYPNSLNQAKITLAPELDKDITVEKISHEYTCKNP